MSRNILNDPARNTGRDITNTGTRSFSNTAIEPVEITEITSRSSTIGLKGLSGFTADKIIKVNSAGDALEYATETDTVYTLQSPLSFISPNKIQIQQTLFNISTIVNADFVPYFNSNGNFDRMTFANFKAQIPDTNTIYTLVSPLSFVSGTTTQIQLDTTLFNTQTTLNVDDLFLYIDPNGNYDNIRFDNLKALIDTNTTYTGASPIVLSGTEFQIDFSGLTDYGGGVITNETEFLVSTDGDKTMRALTYSKLKTDLDSALFQYTTVTSINDADVVLFFDETGIVSNKYKNITFANFRNLVFSSAIDFGTGTTTGNRTFGNVSYSTIINGSSVVVNGATTLNNNLEIYGNMSLNSTGNFATNNRNITWGAYSGTSITAYLAYFGANESLVLCSRGGSGNLLFCTGSEEATRLTINDDDIIATNNISVINTTATSGAILDLQFQNQGNDTYNYLQFGKNATGSGNSAKLKYYHDSTSSGFNYLSLGLTQGNVLEEQIKIFNSGNIEFLNTGTTVFQAISIQNPSAIGQWNILQNYRFANSSSTTAYSVRVYDYQPSGTNFQYYGIFSNNDVGDGASPTCPFQIRNDGYIELKANYTNTPTTSNGGIGLMGVSNVVPQLKYVSRSGNSAYHVIEQTGLSTGDAWTRWTFAQSGGTDYFGFAHSSGTTGVDCFTFGSNKKLYAGAFETTSDARIKKDIVDADLDECISVMKSIKLKKYRYTDAYQETYNTTTEEVYGFLADDIVDNRYLNYAGEIGARSQDLINGTSLPNIKTIDKAKILTVLWGVCTDQQNKLEQQQAEISSLRADIDNIKSLLQMTGNL